MLCWKLSTGLARKSALPLPRPLSGSGCDRGILLGHWRIVGEVFGPQIRTTSATSGASKTHLGVWSKMKFAIVRSLNRNRVFVYESMIMEMGASPKWTRSFDKEDDMIEIVVRLLGRQKRADDLRKIGSETVATTSLIST
jgi:hypothetical protein